MNILIFNWRDPKNPLSGGAEAVTMQHAKFWVRQGHQVTWFTSRFAGAKKQEIVNGVRIIRQGGQVGIIPLVYLFAPFFYWRHKNSFDIVIDEIHGISFFTPLFVDKPKIAFIHEVAGQIWDSMYPFPLNILGKLSEKLILLLYHKIQFWTDAPSTVDELVKLGIPRQNCVAIACPAMNATVSQLPKKSRGRIFICISRLVKMKGIEDVLKAFSLIAQQEKDVRLWIVGDGEPHYVNSLKAKARSDNISKLVTFWGRVEEPQKLNLLRRAHLLLHASIKEGWGLVILEAASMGTPSVVYNVNGLRDTVINGKTGVIVENNTPEALAGESLKLINDSDLYQRLQKNGLTRSKSLTWNQVADESINLLKRLV